MRGFKIKIDKFKFKWFYNEAVKLNILKLEMLINNITLYLI